MRDIVCAIAPVLEAWTRFLCVLSPLSSSVNSLSLRRLEVNPYSFVSASHDIVAIATVTDIIDMLEIVSLLHFLSPRYFVAIDVISDIAILRHVVYYRVKVVVIAALAR
jgi:hypothetical protein